MLVNQAFLCRSNEPFDKQYLPSYVLVGLPCRFHTLVGLRLSKEYIADANDHSQDRVFVVVLFRLDKKRYRPRASERDAVRDAHGIHLAVVVHTARNL